jgi:hypothetical protein
MIKAKVTDLELSKDEIPKQKITSILDNFESGERIYYQGDEPIVEVEAVEQKVDIPNIDIDSLTDEQLLKLKQRLGL